MANRAERLAGLFVVALAGCGTISNARDAQDDAKAVPGERTPTASEIGLPSSGTITVAQVVDAALAVHPSVLQARHQAEAAEARVGQQEAAFWPTVSTGPLATYRYQTSNSTTGHQTHNARGSQSFGFNVSMLIFDFGKTPALCRQAAQQSLAAQRDLRATEVAIAFNARSAYFNLVKQRELLVVAQETVRQFETRLVFVEGFVKVGTRVPYDLTKAQVDLGNARLSEIKTRNALRVAEANLANAVGLAEVASWTPAEAPPLTPFTLLFDELWEEARKNQPALGAASAREQAAKDLVDAQIAALYPSITASAGFSASGFDFPLTWNWNVGPNLNWILFNGFDNYYSIDEAAASLRTARASKAEIEQQVWLEVRTAYVSLEGAKERMDLTALTVRQAEQNLNLIQGRYDVGRATAVELTDAQVALATARADQVQARADYDTAIALLWKSLGVTTWTR